MTKINHNRVYNEYVFQPNNMASVATSEEHTIAALKKHQRQLEKQLKDCQRDLQARHESEFAPASEPQRKRTKANGGNGGKQNWNKGDDERLNNMYKDVDALGGVGNSIIKWMHKHGGSTKELTVEQKLTLWRKLQDRKKYVKKEDLQKKESNPKLKF